MSQHLLIISIGPVQEFIASARRSRDLWFGSWLLSELSKAAALSIVKQHQNDLSCLIFPSADNLSDLQENSNFNVVNKIVVLSSHDPSRLDQVTRQDVLNRLKEIRDEAYNKIPSNNYFLRKTADEQIEDLIEYFWAACPLTDPKDSKEYERVRKQAESLLAARKVTRDFKAVTWGDYVPKSSLDGLRESVIHEEVYNRVGEGKMTKEQLRRDYGVREGERLCGVGLLKRHGNRGNDDSFFSTSHVAALPLLQQLTDKKAVDKYLSTLTDELGLPSKELGKVPAWPHTPHPAFGRYDGHLLFEERLRELFEEKHKLEKAKEALSTFLTNALGGQRPGPYYALLLADGDRMGKAIDEQKNVEDHRKLSSNLTQFAKSVRHIVEDEYQGSLVYSGGDDVLAFVPLHTVLACARRLADEFQKQLAKFKVKEGAVEVSPTLSVGIAVTHHLEPLSDALEAARNAEKIAKRVDGKNALAVTVSKRSGADCTVKGKWGELDERLNRFVVLHRTDAVPDGAAYELRDLSLRLEGLPDDAMLRTEAIRILQRKRAAHGKEEIAQKVLKKLIKLIQPSHLSVHQLADELIEAPRLSVHQLADELIVAREFASATELAGITPEELQAKLPKQEEGKES